ncbi:hypothetical protein REPUB_Repub11eG0055300 [Reevesia pubescens]
MATKDQEAGLKMIEELTTNAHQIQEQVLQKILMRNAGTEYLSRFLHGQTDNQHFKNSVPIVTYEDIKPYIDRIANGEPSDILLAEPVIEFHLSTGTSGGQPKLIPVTAEIYNQRAVYLSLLRSVMKKHFGDLDQAGKRMELLFAKTEIETPSGLKARAVSTSIFKESGFRTILSKLYTSPIEAIFCLDTNQSMFCQLLAGLIQRDEVVTFGSIFAAAVLRAIKFLEDNWKELCSNIKTGVMSQYIATLEFYSGGLPLVSVAYACSEAICGINLELLSKPTDVSYTFLPNMAYFEFLPVKKDSDSMSQEVHFNAVSQDESLEMMSNNEDIEPVDLVDVKPGQCYELLVTNSGGLYRYKVGDILMATGFHNNTPQFQFVGRQNVILSIDTDKTSESDLLKAVTEAKTLLDPVGFFLTGYTSYGDTTSIPGHYVLFWELKVKEGNNIKELDPKIMVECCTRMEESLDFTYRMYRKDNVIAPLEIRVVKQGSFDALMDYSVSQGASMSQYKSPSCIKSKDAVKILDSKVIGKFFSPKAPM